MIDALAETPPKKGYQEVEGTDELRFYFLCHCGQRIKRRRDAFMPGLHVLICLACHNISTDIKMLSGEEVGQRPTDHKVPDDLAPPAAA